MMKKIKNDIKAVAEIFAVTTVGSLIFVAAVTVSTFISGI